MSDYPACLRCKREVGWSREASSGAVDECRQGLTAVAIEAEDRVGGDATDGEAEVWVDGEQEFLRQNIDWRGTWDEYGINAIRFTNYANASGEQRDCFINDVVAGTGRVGCNGLD